MGPSLDPTKALHTWSLFRTMGRFVAAGSAPSGALTEHEGTDGLSLLELPGQLAAHGFTSAQLCHFYLPTTDDAYLGELREAFETAGVDIECFLVDDGDIVDPDGGEDAQRWLSSWIEVAEALGVPRVRVPAGDQAPTEELLQLSARRLRALAGAHTGLRVLTENWKGLLVDATTTLRLLELVEGEVGLLIDTGNWTGADKYEQIAAVAGQAEASQVKARETSPGELDTGDLTRALTVLRDAGYAGRISLVYAGTDDDEWGSLERMHEIARTVTG